MLYLICFVTARDSSREFVQVMQNLLVLRPKIPVHSLKVETFVVVTKKKNFFLIISESFGFLFRFISLELLLNSTFFKNLDKNRQKLILNLPVERDWNYELVALVN